MVTEFRLLPSQRELQRQTEITGCGRVAAAGEQWGVCLLIIIGGEGKQTTQGIVGHKREFESRVAT